VLERFCHERARALAAREFAHQEELRMTELHLVAATASGLFSAASAAMRFAMPLPFS